MVVYCKTLILMRRKTGASSEIKIPLWMGSFLITLSLVQNGGFETDELSDKSQTSLAVGQSRHSAGWEVQRPNLVISGA